MASSSDYQELSRAISANVASVFKNRSISETQEMFKEGSEISSVLSLLAEREKTIKEIPLEIREELQFLKDELVQINKLQQDINQLSSSVNAATTNFGLRKAINNFDLSSKQNKEVKQGFVGTLFSVVYNYFVPKSSQKIDNAKIALSRITNKFINEIEEFKPNSPKLEPETSKVLDTAPGVANQLQTKTSIVKPPPPNYSPVKPAPIPPPPNYSPVKPAPIPPPPNYSPVKPAPIPPPPNYSPVKPAPIPPPPPPPPPLSQASASSPATSLKNELEQKVQPKHVESTEDKIKARTEEIQANISKDQGKFKYNEIDTASISILDGKNKDQQLNILYSAMLDGKDDLVKEFKTHQSVDLESDDWGIETDTFSKEDIKTLENAVIQAKERSEKEMQEAPIKAQEEIKNLEEKIAIAYKASEMKKQNQSMLDPLPASSSAVKENFQEDIAGALNKIKTSIDGQNQAEELLFNKNEEQQLKILYDKVIKGEVKLVENIIEYTPDDEDTSLAFTQENCVKLYEDAYKHSQSIKDHEKKILIEEAMRPLVEPQLQSLQNAILANDQGLVDRIKNTDKSHIFTENNVEYVKKGAKEILDTRLFEAIIKGEVKQVEQCIATYEMQNLSKDSFAQIKTDVNQWAQQNKNNKEVGINSDKLEACLKALGTEKKSFVEKVGGKKNQQKKSFSERVGTKKKKDYAAQVEEEKSAEPTNRSK